MNTNPFMEHELVTRKVKVGNEWQTKTFPVVGGRLRIAHESNERLEIQTEIVRLDNDFVVVKASVETGKGTFAGTGNSLGSEGRQACRFAGRVGRNKGRGQSPSLWRYRG